MPAPRLGLRLAAAAAFAASASAQILGGGGGGSSGCSLADWGARTQEVDTVCCSGPNAAPDACVGGAPTACDLDCSYVYIPWFTECHEILESAIFALRSQALSSSLPRPRQDEQA